MKKLLLMSACTTTLMTALYVPANTFDRPKEEVLDAMECSGPRSQIFKLYHLKLTDEQGSKEVFEIEYYPQKTRFTTQIRADEYDIEFIKTKDSLSFKALAKNPDSESVLTTRFILAAKASQKEPLALEIQFVHDPEKLRNYGLKNYDVLAIEDINPAVYNCVVSVGKYPLN